MNDLTPIQEKDRIVNIDVIRGFALLGIFMVNILDFSSPWLYLETGIMWNSSIDILTESLIDIFAQASFYTLFSFLFGFGMVIFKERAIEKGNNFLILHSRRLFVLLLIGIIHAFLIWHGDILISYAVIGFILILFHNAKPKTLLIWSLALIIIPTILLGNLMYQIELSNPEQLSNYNEAMVEQSIEVYSSGTFIEITKQRIKDWSYVNNLFGFVILTFILLPMFLLGAFFAKKRWFHDPVKYRNELKKVWFISLVLAVTFKSLPYLSKYKETASYIQDAVGGPASAIFYATSIVLLMEKIFWRKKLINFSYVGRMSLTNYLLQSVISTLIFYSYGLGLYGKVRPIYGVLLVVIIYIFQILISKLWLKYFSIGPVEWIWRILTYLNKPTLRRK